MKGASDTNLHHGLGAEEPSRKFMVFQLGLERYAFPIHVVKEIVTKPSVTRVPNTPEHVRGVINLRGKIVPVFDLRLKLGMDWRDYDEETCYTILEVAHDKGLSLVAVAVDTVLETSSFTEEQISEAPDISGESPARILEATSTDDQGAVLIVSVVELFRNEFQFPDEIEA